MLGCSCIGLTVMIRENKMAGNAWRSKMLTTCLGYKKVVVEGLSASFEGVTSVT